ncbi:MAG: LamG-like jellyroll fold domain-containing protein [Verrucomicrobiales bacterium]
MSKKLLWAGLIPLLGLACLNPIVAQGNDMDPDTEFYTALKTPVAIVLDGDLSEWGGANVIDNPRFSMFPKGIGFENATPDEIVTHDEYGSGTWDGPDDQASVTRMLYDDENFYLGVVVTDDYHEHSAGGAGSTWNGDAIQLMVADGDRASQVALVNVALLGIEEDEPAGEDFFAVHNEAAPEGTEVFIVRDTVAKTTTYEIRLPLEVVGLDALEEGVTLGIGFAINDGDLDSPGQSGWGGWGAHSVVGGKTPSETGLVTLGGVATAGNGGPPLIAHFPLDADGNSADGAFVATDTIDVEFGSPGANSNTGTSASFNGASSVIHHDWSADLNPEGSFTLALWAKSNGGAGAWNSPVTSRHDLNTEGETSQGYLIYDSSDTGVWTFWSGNGEDPGNWQTLPSPNPVELGVWQHVTIIYDADQEMKKLYVDGELVAESEDTITPNDTTPFNIGAGQDFGDGFWFDGEIDDIGLWGAALTESQIAQVMEGGVASLGGAPDLVIDFNDGLPEGVQIFGNAEVRDEGGVDDSGFLSVTDALNGQSGAVIFPDLLNGKAVKSFKFTADVRVGGGTADPADGFSINLVRPDDPTLTGNGGGFNVVPEEGTVSGLSIGFDEWDSGAPDLIGFSVHVDGETVTQVPAPVKNGDADDPESLQTGPDADSLTWQPFEVELDPEGKVSISWKGVKVLDKFQTTFAPSPVRIVFGGRTGDANSNHHVDNIGLSIDPLTLLAVSRITSSSSGIVFQISNSDDSVVDKASIALKVDGETVTPVVEDIDGGVRISFVATVAFLPGSTHTYELTAKDTNGNDAVRSGAGDVKLRDSELPFNTPLVGPEGGPGEWGVRYIWGAGSPGNNAGAIRIIQSADDADFDGQVFDTTAEVANLGAGVGYFPDDLLYPDEVVAGEDGLWNGENFIVVYKGTLRISESGLYTFGVHSDDGFGLRIWGGEFVSENGNGSLDTIATNTVVHPDPTGDSNTRAVANLAAGDYPIEFFWYENGGGDNGELYFAKGEFLEDGDTDTWELVGGDNLVGASGPPFQIVDIQRSGTDVTITFQSIEGAGYTIEKATPEQLATGEFEELQDGYEGQAGDTTSFTDTGVADSEVYYRVRAE